MDDSGDPVFNILSPITSTPQETFDVVMVDVDYSAEPFLLFEPRCSLEEPEGSVALLPSTGACSRSVPSPSLSGSNPTKHEYLWNICIDQSSSALFDELVDSPPLLQDDNDGLMRADQPDHMDLSAVSSFTSSVIFPEMELNQKGASHIRAGFIFADPFPPKSLGGKLRDMFAFRDKIFAVRDGQVGDVFGRTAKSAPVRLKSVVWNGRPTFKDVLGLCGLSCC